MKIQKTWLTVRFNQGDAHIELTINYLTKEISMTHGHNDNNVTFNDNINNIKVLEDRLKCTRAALAFAKKELLTV